MKFFSRIKSFCFISIANCLGHTLANKLGSSHLDILITTLACKTQKQFSESNKS